MLKEFVAAAKAKLATPLVGGTGRPAISPWRLSRRPRSLQPHPFKGGAEVDADHGRRFPVSNRHRARSARASEAGRCALVAIPQRRRSPTCRRRRAGLPGFESVGWIGLCAPARTPGAILDKLNAEVQKMLASPEAKEKFQQLAFTAAGDSREHFAAWIRAEIVKWSRIAKESGARAD
jgi:tripartite-type tricarboxylate transporter receptor subunit TctC